MRDFAGSPVANTPCLHCRGTGLAPGQGAKRQHAAQCVGAALTVPPPTKENQCENIFQGIRCILKCYCWIPLKYQLKLNLNSQNY